MVRMFALALASTAVAGTASLALASGSANHPAPAAALNATAQTSAAARPQYGTFGFDLAGMDRNVRPGDDFFDFANGTWIANNQIPADKSRYGMFNVLDDLSRERTRTIIEEQAKDPNSRIGNAYASFMDEAAVESKGLTPLNPWLDQIRGVKSKADLARIYAQGDE